MLQWAQPLSILLFLDNNDYPSPYCRYECLLAAGSIGNIAGNVSDALSLLAEHHKEQLDWLFGHIVYDYKNFLEKKLLSSHPVKTGFPDIHFFCPEIVCYIEKGCDTLVIESATLAPANVYEQIINTEIPQTRSHPALHFSQAINKTDYLETIARLRQHIADGDCYEINFCNHAFCDNALIDPLQVFKALNSLSPAPFAAYYRLEDKYMMCASPERYLQKNADRIIAQPIKGTARRDADMQRDAEIKNALQQDIKERAENVMIVDLMRNDLARCCETGSISVDELFGVYTFPQVHQLISTISGKLKKDIPFTDAIRTSFPMGSMTGAPKIKVMQLIDQYETSRRELFSGTIGYISPAGDFDFNVIIRSLFYNASSQYLSYHTGGAITYDSDPQKEWEEMRLKAWALERIFT